MSSDNPFESPQADIRPVVPQDRVAENRTLTWLLFSFRGRIPRRTFWGVSIAAVFIFYVVIFLAAMVFGVESDVWEVVILPLYVPLLWISLAVQAKRWHDRGNSAWWILIQFIPILGPIWAFIENGCLRGTVGPNQYGPDPT